MSGEGVEEDTGREPHNNEQLSAKTIEYFTRQGWQLDNPAHVETLSEIFKVIQAIRTVEKLDQQASPLREADKLEETRPEGNDLQNC